MNDDFWFSEEFSSNMADKRRSGEKDSVQSLSAVVNRAKARWLNRVMYAPQPTSTAKCLAYAVHDHLNCATLDCWPAQERLARILGNRCERTVSRASHCLEVHGHLAVNTGPGKRSCRYAPIFQPSDFDSIVLKFGHKSPSNTDSNVDQSFLSIPLLSSSKAGSPMDQATEPYSRNQQGTFEKIIVARFGIDGWKILERLNSLDEAIVVRLCRAQAEGALSDRDLHAARLAAEQLR